MVQRHQLRSELTASHIGDHHCTILFPYFSTLFDPISAFARRVVSLFNLTTTILLFQYTITLR